MQGKDFDNFSLPTLYHAEKGILYLTIELATRIRSRAIADIFYFLSMLIIVKWSFPVKNIFKYNYKQSDRI